MINRTRLYLLVIISLVAGYIWFIYNVYKQNQDISNSGFNLCVIKSLTGIPCPSCGTTRSVIEIVEGNFLEALLYNPLGYLIASMMLVLPCWIIYDLSVKKSSFYNFYRKTESFISKTYIAAILIFLILINWCWNIFKGL